VTLETSSAGRIGLIGGLSWESTACYYRYLNQFHHGPSPWSQPSVVIDSLDMAEIEALQRQGDWTATGVILADSAQRLVAAGATVLAIGANTMHKNYDAVAAAVDVPVLDVRSVVAREAQRLGATRLGLLGTRYVIEQDFYVDGLRAAGVDVVRPDGEQTAELHRIIFDELTQGLVTVAARDTLLAIAASLAERGAEVVGLCCTEFGLLLKEGEGPVALIDSTKAHVRALLDALATC
jgi:aspartate racemase